MHQHQTLNTSNCYCSCSNLKLGNSSTRCIRSFFYQAEIDHEDKNIFVEPPEDVTVPNGHVYKLARSLYGLRTSPKRWSQHLSKTLFDSGRRKSKFNPSCYMNNNSIIITHVDDLSIFGTTNAVQDHPKQEQHKDSRSILEKLLCLGQTKTL